jgi:O-antigen ligase
VHDLRAAQLRLGLVEVAGAAVTVFAAYVSVRLGARIGVGLVAVAALYLGFVLAFLAVPHVAVAVTVPVFALVPAAKVLVSPSLGPVKDVISLAAITAAALVLVLERRRPDGTVLALVAILLGLYVVDVGGGHGIAWAQGVRLIGEPLLLLVAGLTLPSPRRTLHWALASLVATGCGAALYGLLQQQVGQWALVGWGYSFSTQVRTIGGRLRSFGTFDDPFAYAAFLLSSIVAVVFWMRRGTLALVALLVLFAGLGFSYVRTAALIGVGLAGLLLARRGSTSSGVLVVAAALVGGVALLLTNAGGTQTRSYQSGATVITLNGRVSAWKEALGAPREWPFGRGVGTVGTAAQRATYTLSPAASPAGAVRAVDSGYLATIADVGLVGLAVLLALLGRLLTLASAAARRGVTAGWIALGFLVTLLLDAVTRSSFTGFPTAFLGLLLIGVALAAAREELEAPWTRAASAAG